jgi:hypothetical protein
MLQNNKKQDCLTAVGMTQVVEHVPSKGKKYLKKKKLAIGFKAQPDNPG